MDKEKEYARYFNHSLRFISFRPRSEKEVHDYLKEKNKKGKGVPTQETIAKIISRLVELKFINDLEFASFWVNSRNKATRILKFELTQKGVAKEIIEKVLSGVSVANKEEELIKKLIEKKKRSLKVLDSKKVHEKIVGYLLRKGFNYDQIKKYLNKNVEF